MAAIITYPTDQIQAKYGYCSRCFSYNEVWRKDKSSTCNHCRRKMIHIASWKLLLVIATIVIFGIICIVREQCLFIPNISCIFTPY